MLCACLMVLALFPQQSLHALENPLADTQRISIDYKNADLTDVIKAISYSYNLNIVVQKDVSGKVSAQLKDITVDEALHAILSVNNYSYIRKGSVIYILDKNDVTSITESLPLHFLTLKAAKNLLSGALPKFNGVIQGSEDSNNLVVTANPADLESVKECLKGIDVPPIQVLIEAQIIDINKSDIQKLDSAVGLIYSASQTGGQFVKYTPTVGPAESGAAVPFKDNVTDDQSAFTISNNSDKLFSQVSLNALVNNHKARVIASPSIATLNGHEANILIGEKYPYINSTTAAGGTGGGVVNQTTTSYIDIGTKLRVTPRVSVDGWITMKIQPEVSTFLGLVNGNPNIATRSAETEVRVKDNQTIIIGGLKGTSNIRDKNGTPFLKDIPILGALFSSNDKTIVDGELTVLITPHVIPMPKTGNVATPDNSYASTQNRKDNEMIQNILNYAETLDAERTKDPAKNLYLSSEQVKSYRMVLQQFPDSGRSDFCLYRIALIYAKEFGKCDASKEALDELKELDSDSPYVPVTEALVDACNAVNRSPKK